MNDTLSIVNNKMFMARTAKTPPERAVQTAPSGAYQGAMG